MLFRSGLLDASNANSVVKVTKQLNLEDGSLIKANYVNVTDNTYEGTKNGKEDRKSTRLNSSHVSISYAVFCLKKKKTTNKKRKS